MKKFRSFWQNLRRHSPIIDDYLKLFLGMILLVIVLILLYFITNINAALAQENADTPLTASSSTLNSEITTEDNPAAAPSSAPQPLLAPPAASSNANSSASSDYNITLVKTFGNWSLLLEKTYSLNSRCHLVSRPVYTKLFSGLRYDPYLMLSYIPENKFTYSVFLGFDISADRPPVLILQDYQYPLNSYRNSFAYTYDAFEDMAITNTIIKGLDYIRVKSYNRKKQVAMDYYSSKNLLEAMNFTRSYCHDLTPTYPYNLPISPQPHHDPQQNSSSHTKKSPHHPKSTHAKKTPKP